MLTNMKEILMAAKKHGFAVPAFNTSSNMILKGVIEASEEMCAPVIIAIHPDELSFVKGSFIAAVREEAHNSSVPLCIHLDHGTTYEQVIYAIRAGFTSVMIDASLAPFAENVSITRKVVEAAHAAGVSVEAELGTIGSTGNGGEAGMDNIVYTNPDDAVRFVEQTNVDSLAVAIGTSHGLYPKSMKPKLRLDLLQELDKLIPVPLVLHGGSDNPDPEIAAAVELGVCKINISSDIKAAFYNKCREILTDVSLREPNMIYPPCIEAMKQVVYHKITLFKAADKLKYYK